MINFLTRQLYLLAVGGSVAVFAASLAWGWPLEGVVLGWSVLVLATGVWLERLAPFDPRWRLSNDDTGTDATSAVVLIGVVDPLLKAVLPIVALVLLAPLAPSGDGWFLGAAPFALQVVAAVLWIEFSKYWSHRAHHQVAALWWLHALHHGSERLYWLNNFRFHPLNHLANAAVSLLPLLLLGVPPEVLLGAVALTQPVVMLQHLNVRTHNGWLNHVFSTNELHRWHHSAEPQEANSNFGSALVLWDQLFGTFRHQPGQPARVGLFGDGSGYPAKAPYLQQLLSIFTPACCRV
ncbi:MAG TPA: sterol desaturase family protein [Ideonella sp.]|uniref:sterol desaturase family protein n=1 Tax=Ideonella sp. TaxID=1929293 RepID=UPI002E380740|nr:sterol desaturase family protein [Ideonella sp.]HEX5683222.1 sterol desaturase family protein [Ideonella sp.]